MNASTSDSSSASYDFSKVRAKYVRDFGVSDNTARSHEREALRYLELSASKAGAVYTMMGAADDYWHTFMLFSREYADFCNRLAGRFIHHTPADPTKTGEERRVEFANYVAFFCDYLQRYKELPPRSVWPYPTRRMIEAAELSIPDQLLVEFEKYGITLDGPNCNCGCGSPCGNHCGCSKCSCGD